METPWPWQMTLRQRKADITASWDVAKDNKDKEGKGGRAQLGCWYILTNFTWSNTLHWWDQSVDEATLNRMLKKVHMFGWLFQRCNHQRSLEAGPDHITLLAQNIRLMYYGVFLSPENCLGTMMGFMQVARVACNSHIGLYTQIWSDLYSIFSTLSNVLKNTGIGPFWLIAVTADLRWEACSSSHPCIYIYVYYITLFYILL